MIRPQQLNPARQGALDHCLRQASCRIIAREYIFCFSVVSKSGLIECNLFPEALCCKTVLPALDKIEQTRNHPSFLLQPLTQSLDKEKAKVMAGPGAGEMVTKPMAMVSIKEVNESDVSETNSPAPSPSMASEAARARMKDQRSALEIMIKTFK